MKQVWLFSFYIALWIAVMVGIALMYKFVFHTAVGSSAITIATFIVLLKAIIDRGKP